MSHSAYLNKIRREDYLNGEVSLDILGHMLQQGGITLSEYIQVRFGEPKKTPNLPDNLDGTIPSI